MINELLNIFLNIIIFLILLHFSAALHELGHAVMALIFTKKEVRIILGTDDLRKKISIKKLTIEFHQAPISGFYRYSDDGLSIFSVALINLAGPIVSFATAFIIFYLIRDAGKNIYIDILEIYGYTNLSQGIATIIPMRYPAIFRPYKGHKSDGYQFIESINDYRRSRRADRENKTI